jgi:hypothetical protein
MKRMLALAALLAAGADSNSYAQFVRKLAPDFAQIQYAGSNGWMGVGAGYEFFRRRLRTNFQYGYVPPAKGGRLHLFTGAVFYQPVRIKAGPDFRVNPLDFGFKGSYQFGSDYFFRLPSRYPPNYYWWKTRVPPTFGHRIVLNLQIARKYRNPHLERLSRIQYQRSLPGQLCVERRVAADEGGGKGGNRRAVGVLGR